MLILFSLHFLKNLGRCRIMGFQSRGEICVDALIRFLQRNCQRENFLFRQVFEIFCQATSSRYEPTIRISFLRHSITGILAALRRRAIEGGSYRVVVSLTRTVLWLLSLGIFDKAYAKATAGSSDEHKYIAPDLFTAETPLGTYQGMTDQIVMSRTPGAYRTVLVPRGSSKPEWLGK